MNWIKRWLERKQIKDLKQKIKHMKNEAEAAKADKLTLTAATITHRVELLEKAVEKLETQEPGKPHPLA